MKAPLKDLIRKVRLLALDVDGVLTDGRIYLGPNGIEFKAFHTRDGYGIKSLLQSGYEVAIISGRSSSETLARAAELGLRHVYTGVIDKRAQLADLCKALDLSPERAAFMGDDDPDLSALDLAGVALAPADASDSVLAISDWISNQAGGHGAVREACELLLSRRSS